jgi:hypothetical protein
MRFSAIPALALACSAVFLLPACSGGTATTPAAATMSSDVPSNYGDAVRPSNLARRAAAERLAVTNFSDPQYFEGTVVLNRSYKIKQTIIEGASAPSGAHYDSNGNLYVVNSAGPNVDEYNKNGALKFTYSTGLGDPGSVTVDGSGNVYVADWGDDKASVVVEYPQGSNTPLVSCSTGFANAGVAIDSKGHVFVSVDTPQKGSNAGFILEFKHGLSGCKATTLSVNLFLAGKVVIDKHDNLVVCDVEAVDIIAPPYTKISSEITAGFNDPHDVALNKRQTLLYVVNLDPSAPDVVAVDTYPGGKNVTTLGPSDGIPSANGVAVYPQ